MRQTPELKRLRGMYLSPASTEDMTEYLLPPHYAPKDTGRPMTDRNVECNCRASCQRVCRPEAVCRRPGVNGSRAFAEVYTTVGVLKFFCSTPDEIPARIKQSSWWDTCTAAYYSVGR